MIKQRFALTAKKCLRLSVLFVSLLIKQTLAKSADMLSFLNATGAEKLILPILKNAKNAVLAQRKVLF